MKHTPITSPGSGSLRFTCAVALLSCAFAAQAVAANLFTNPGFETDEPTYIFGFPGVPPTSGDWGGDPSDIVTTENGITPRGGSRMLRFDATGNTADPVLTTADIYQLVDVSTFSGAIDAGLATANASAWFNRVPGDAQTDTSMSVRIYAFSGSLSNFQADLTAGSWLAFMNGGIGTDGDVATWEQASTSLPLPVGTDYLGIRLLASENVFNDGTAPEFDGHYGDDMFLDVTVIPEPASGLLAGLGLAALAGMRRRRRE